MVGALTQLFEQRWRGELSEYVTAIAWSATGMLATSSAAGEVSVFSLGAFAGTSLQAGTGKSVDCLAFSQAGQFLAAAGQAGQVWIWRLVGVQSQLVATLENAPAWVDQLAWNPSRNELAFNLGKYIQVWDAVTQTVIATLNFDNSSVLDLSWTADGQRLTAAGYQGIKVWTAADWQDDPYVLTMLTVSTAIAWSPDNRYIASGNMDRTVTVLEWENPSPWVMRGFPGKLRKLTWSQVVAKKSPPLFAAASAESVVVWKKHPDETVGWDGQVLGSHEAVIDDLAFQPGTNLLATAAADGFVGIWQNATQLAQALDGAAAGFTCLAWHPQGNWLAAGGSQGELLVWGAMTSGRSLTIARGKGFSRR